MEDSYITRPARASDYGAANILPKWRGLNKVRECTVVATDKFSTKVIDVNGHV